MPLASSAVASLASHSCSCSCQQLHVFVDAKTPVYSCDQSVIQQNMRSQYYVLGRGPDAPGVTYHFGAWNAFPPFFLPCGLWGQRELGCNETPSFTSCVITNGFLTFLLLSSSECKEWNTNVKLCKMMSYIDYLAQCLEHSVKTRVSQPHHC